MKDKKNMGHSKAYANQAKAPTGRGSRGPSQNDGGPISGWDKPVSDHGAYAAQEKWGKGSAKSASLGFKFGENSSYLGHFAQEKFLREGHNTSGKPDMNGSPSPSPYPNEETQKRRQAFSDSYNEGEKTSTYEKLKKVFSDDK